MEHLNISATNVFLKTYTCSSPSLLLYVLNKQNNKKQKTINGAGLLRIVFYSWFCLLCYLVKTGPGSCQQGKRKYIFPIIFTMVLVSVSLQFKEYHLKDT